MSTVQEADASRIALSVVVGLFQLPARGCVFPAFHRQEHLQAPIFILNLREVFPLPVFATAPQTDLSIPFRERYSADDTLAHRYVLPVSRSRTSMRATRSKPARSIVFFSTFMS